MSSAVLAREKAAPHPARMACQNASFHFFITSMSHPIKKPTVSQMQAGPGGLIRH